MLPSETEGSVSGDILIKHWHQRAETPSKPNEYIVQGEETCSTSFQFLLFLSTFPLFYSYLFSIPKFFAVLSARHLIGKDMVGTSDPFVCVSLISDPTAQSLVQTKVVKGSLNPTYIEEFIL